MSGDKRPEQRLQQRHCTVILLCKTEAFTAADTGDWPRQFIAAVHAAETVPLSLCLTLCATMLHVTCSSISSNKDRIQVRLHSTPPTDSRESTVLCEGWFDDACI